MKKAARPGGFSMLFVCRKIPQFGKLSRGGSDLVKLAAFDPFAVYEAAAGFRAQLDGSGSAPQIIYI